MEVNIQHAKANLSKLIAAAERGEDVIIARRGKPVVKLVAIEAKPRSRRDTIGSGIGKIWITPDFGSEEADKEITDLFEDSLDEIR